MRAVVSGRAFDLDRREVERAVRVLTPEPVRRHYVEIAGVRYPVKQAMAAATGLDRNTFTSQQAGSVLTKLGFQVGALDGGRAHEARVPYERSSVRAWWVDDPGLLAGYEGKWVALGESSVMYAGDSPSEVTAWLRARRLRARRLMLVGGEPLDPTGMDLRWPEP